MHIKIIKNHITNFPNPISFSPGDKLKLGKKDSEYPGWVQVTTQDNNVGWAPIAYISHDSRNNMGTALNAYNAKELTVTKGDVLIIQKELNGWLYCQDSSGDFGWIPRSHCEISHK